MNKERSEERTENKEKRVKGEKRTKKTKRTNLEDGVVGGGAWKSLQVSTAPHQPLV